MQKRYLTHAVREDLQQKMAFLGGPRQVGKTTLARFLSEEYPSHLYLNWDNPQHKNQIIQQQWPPDTQCIVFDEIHKYNKWKNHIKGIWDTRHNNEKICVTGSSRLDIYRRGGDSLLGRYHYFTLHPFSLKEWSGFLPSLIMPQKCHDLVFEQSSSIAELFTFGGFPEPLLDGRERTLLRWQNERFERIFREDIRDVEKVRSLSQVELLGALLPKRVASPLSLASLSEDVQTSPKTIINWMDLLCRNYYCFKVMPWHQRLERALKKESKYYLWDWSEISNEGARFENMIGSHLLKFCDYYHDVFGIPTKLWYLRDREGREVDFLVSWGETPWFMVECKLTPGPARPLNYFADRLDVEQKFLVTMDERRHYLDKKTGVHVIPASRFLMGFV